MRTHIRIWAQYLVLVTLSVGIVFLVYVTLTSPPTSERTETVFVYGTLTNPLVRTIACRCLTERTPATLPDYKKVGRTIVPKPGADVAGGLIEVSPLELTRLDRYEGTPTHYRREIVQIGGKSAWVYIKNEFTKNE